MANYNPLTSPRVERNRNGFDLSQNHVFSAKIGQLLPILSIDCVPGDYHEIDVAALSKTMPVRTDAFARVKQNFEFFFVPYEQLWHNWSSFISQRYVKKTTLTKVNNMVPYFDRQNFIAACARGLNYYDFQGESYGRNALRLADLLGYGSYQHVVHTESSYTPSSYVDQSGYKLNAFRICAYNKIWYDYYRNKFFDTSKDHLYSFNLDDIGATEFPSSTQDDILIDRSQDHDNWFNNVLVPAESQSGDPAWVAPYSLFQMRYRQYKKDLFTSALPSQQFGLVETLPFSDSFRLWQKDNPNSNQTAIVLGGNYPDSQLGRLGNIGQGNSNLNWFTDASINIYAVKKAEALQHWKETVMRAGEDFRQQMEARYGVKPKFTSLDSVDFIGSCSSDVEINPIYSTAQTEGAGLGEIAGRGQSITDGKIQYHSSDFGILMCIYSLVPDVNYCSLGIDKQNTFSDPFDFFTPEIEDLGLEPIFGYQLDSTGRVSASDTTITFGNPQETNRVRGYTSRYSCYKTAVDKVHGEFQNIGNEDTVAHGSFSSWVLDRYDLIGYPASLAQFYIRPYVASNIFASTDSDESSDHFLVNAFFKINSVREMSVLGLPRW